jgi:hypothetical protein
MPPAGPGRRPRRRASRRPGAIDEHHRLPDPQLADRAIDDVVAEPSPSERLADATLASHPDPFGAVAPGDDRHAIAVGDAALALLIGVAGEAASAAAALERAIPVAPDASARSDRSRKPTDRELYRQRRATNEPAFGQLNLNPDFRRFQRRGRACRSE